VIWRSCTAVRAELMVSRFNSRLSGMISVQ
jgi:hypothetical protein